MASRKAPMIFFLTARLLSHWPLLYLSSRHSAQQALSASPSPLGALPARTLDTRQNPDDVRFCFSTKHAHPRPPQSADPAPSRTKTLASQRSREINSPQESLAASGVAVQSANSPY